MIENLHVLKKIYEGEEVSGEIRAKCESLKKGGVRSLLTLLTRAYSLQRELSHQERVLCQDVALH